MRVETDGAYASAALDAELARLVQLSPADRRLATELVYGVLRCGRFLDTRIGKYAKKGVAKLNAEVRIHLRVAVYQIAILERIPAFAAVSEAVDLVRKAEGEHASKFANAVLRRIAADVQEHGKVPRLDAVRSSLDQQLVRLVSEALGSREEAYAMLCAGPMPPPLGIRVHANRSKPDDQTTVESDVDSWVKLLANAGPGLRVERGRVCANAICVTGAGRPADLPGCGVGWSVQEEGSQVVAASLGVRAGETVLDACAGRGNKTLVLAEQVGSTGCVDAADLHESKLVQLRERALSLGLSVRDVYAVDWSVGVGDVPDHYDRVLVDAPCSGVGTIRRRPEIALRDLSLSLPGLRELQVQILLAASTRCRTGGTVVYSVCSVLRAEAEGVVEAVLSRGALLEPVEFGADHEVQPIRGKKSVRLLPREHGTDGYFLACFRKLGI